MVLNVRELTIRYGYACRQSELTCLYVFSIVCRLVLCVREPHFHPGVAERGAYCRGSWKKAPLIRMMCRLGPGGLAVVGSSSAHCWKRRDLLQCRQKVCEAHSCRVKLLEVWPADWAQVEVIIQ